MQNTKRTLETEVEHTETIWTKENMREAAAVLGDGLRKVKYVKFFGQVYAVDCAIAGYWQKRVFSNDNLEYYFGSMQTIQDAIGSIGLVCLNVGGYIADLAVVGGLGYFAAKSVGMYLEKKLYSSNKINNN